MRTAGFSVTWSFILAVAAYDSHFAWRYRTELQDWELNPVASWSASVVGLPAVLGFKIATITLAMALAAYCRYRHHRLAMPMTVIIGAAYLLLSVYYFVGQMPQAGCYGIPKYRLIGHVSTQT
jgi:hypothetical protein